MSFVSGLTRLAHVLFGLISIAAWIEFGPWMFFFLYLSYHIYQFVERFILSDTVWIDLREYYAGLAAGVVLVWLQHNLLA